jgi:hypothetical protein
VKAARVVQALRTRWLIRFGRTDTRRWARHASFDAAWVSRQQLMAGWVRPFDVVIDVGSGPRAFERELPAGCRYLPVDVVPRGPGSVVCDLNRDRLPDLQGDFVLMSGVLEYLHDVPGVLAWTARTASRGAASYASSELFPDRRERRAHGWVNEHTEAEVRQMLRAAGWDVVEDVEWANQRVYRLQASRP